MKKLLLPLFILPFISCEGPQGIDGIDGKDGLIAEVFELKNVDFVNDPEKGYMIYQSLSPELYPGDVLLVYRLSGTIDSKTPIWQQIPRTIYFVGSTNELDYDFDFSVKDYSIYAKGNYNLSTTPAYLNDQTFRIVIVPGELSKNINSKDYISVMSDLNLSENQVQKIQN